jgi:hypothetical protein
MSLEISANYSPHVSKWGVRLGTDLKGTLDEYSPTQAQAHSKIPTLAENLF